MHCNRPDTDQQLDVGDVSGHTISLTQTTCSWTKPLVIDGIPDTEGVSSQIGEIQDGNYTSHGYFVDTMSSGDKVFLRYEATVTMTDGEVQSVQGKWNFTGGTGKFKGIQGDGTFSGNAEKAAELPTIWWEITPWQSRLSGIVGVNANIFRRQVCSVKENGTFPALQLDSDIAGWL